jgi:hypothetical protein
MTHDLAWDDRVKSEYDELLGRIMRLDGFLKSEPNIDRQDILLLKAQLDAMRGYAEILVARLHYHNIEIDEEESK